MKLNTISILRLPGVENLMLSELSTGLNIIIGDNGSGKTTTCRAIQALLWPELTPEHPYPEIFSSWTISNKKIDIEIRGKEYSRIEDNLVVHNGSSLPSYLASCFVITIDDLIHAADDTGAELASRIRKEMSGWIRPR